MIVYGSSLSPFVRKVLAFAAEKGIELELKPTGLGNKDPIPRGGPFARCPAFGMAIRHSDSSAIIAYLEAVKPEPNLIPAETQGSGATIWYDEFADTILFACGGKSSSTGWSRRASSAGRGRGSGREGRCEELPPLLDYLRRVIPASNIWRGPADARRHRGGEPVRQFAAHPCRARPARHPSSPPMSRRSRPAELQALDRPRDRLPERTAA